MLPYRKRRGSASGVERASDGARLNRSEEHTSELQSHVNLVCRLLLEKKKKIRTTSFLRERLQRVVSLQPTHPARHADHAISRRQCVAIDLPEQVCGADVVNRNTGALQ